MVTKKRSKRQDQESVVPMVTARPQGDTSVANNRGSSRARRGHRIRDPARVAVGSFSGYRFQILHTLRAWLSIGDDKLIIAEGNEDIDHVFLNREEHFEEQIKLRSGPVGQLDAAVIETVLNYVKAFLYHDQQGSKFVGILRTNAPLAQRPSTEIGRWIAGEKVKSREFLNELRTHAAATDGDYTNGLAYLSSPDKLAAFLDSVEWAGRSGTPDEVRSKISELLCARASSVPENITYQALLVHLLDKLSQEDVEQRVLRRIDVDLVISDAALERMLRSATQESATAWAAALWTSQGPPSVAVAVLVRDVRALKHGIEAQLQADAAARRDRDLDSVLREMIRSMDFVAYASRRMHSGKRGERVCAHDVVKQVKHRITPVATVISTDAAPWVDAWVKKRWPESRRVPWDAPDGALLRIAKLIGMAVVDDIGEKALLRAIESKLRWVHDIGAGTYFNAANPLY